MVGIRLCSRLQDLEELLTENGYVDRLENVSGRSLAIMVEQSCMFCYH